MKQQRNVTPGQFKIIKGIRRKNAPSESSCCSASSGTADKPPCCGPATSMTGGLISEKSPGFISWLDSSDGRIARISSTLDFRDHVGSCKVRWGIGRMKFIVPPGLYAIGLPDPADPVVVTCNYKMTYDMLRSTLIGRNCWLLVLETHGVNVWCAAGKGTFGTDELIRRVIVTGLARVVTHRRLIVPILGAPGIAAHKVKQRSGFSVSYAAIRAADLPEYLDNGMITTPAMRTLTFTLYERLVLIPVELLQALSSIAVIGCVALLSAYLTGTPAAGITVFLAYLGAVLGGVVVGPLLLPWLPGRSFALKGAFVGMVWSYLFFTHAAGSWGGAATGALFLALPAITAFYTLNFTGCAPYPSRSGVKREMRVALPIMGCALLVSLVLLVVERFR